jgi:hypothetical protein
LRGGSDFRADPSGSRAARGLAPWQRSTEGYSTPYFGAIGLMMVSSMMVGSSLRTPARLRRGPACRKPPGHGNTYMPAVIGPKLAGFVVAERAVAPSPQPVHGDKPSSDATTPSMSNFFQPSLVRSPPLFVCARFSYRATNCPPSLYSTWLQLSGTPPPLL